MIDRRTKKMMDEQIDNLLEQFFIERGARDFTKRDAVAYTLKRFAPPKDEARQRIMWHAYLWHRASRRIAQKKNRRREFEGYHVPGEGHRFRRTRDLHFDEFKLVVSEYEQRKEAATAKHDFLLEVQEKAEQLQLDVGNQPIAAAWDAIVAQRGDDPFGLAEAA